ncbi:MAG: DUF58 domain-containing protein [Acetanaerobacterium sp.]
MKPVRMVFFALFAGCLLAGLLTGVRVFFLIVFIQLGVLLLCLALSLWTVLHFCYVQTVDREELVKGDTVELHLRIHNDMPYPFTMMRVHVSAISAQEDVSYRFALPAHGHIEFNPRFLCAFCGQSEVGMSRVEIEDVFGLTHLNFNMLRLSYYRKRSVLVYPRVHELSHLASYAPDEKNFSGTSLNLTGFGDSFAGVREYRAGDAQKRIHWKASARTHKLHTRIYEHASETHCLVCIDTRTCGASGERARMFSDMLCEAAATILYHALASGHGVKLCRADDGADGVVAHGLRDFPRLHRWLALLEFERESGGEEDARAGVIASLAQERETNSAYLLTMDCARTLCASAAGTALPFEGVTIFAVGETGRQTTSVAGNIRHITVSLADSVAMVLEEML